MIEANVPVIVPQNRRDVLASFLEWNEIEEQKLIFGRVTLRPAIDSGRPCVVCGERQLDVPAELNELALQILRPDADVRLRVEELRGTHRRDRARGRRHHLHETARAHQRNGLRVERALLAHECQDQKRIDVLRL